MGGFSAVSPAAPAFGGGGGGRGGPPAGVLAAASPEAPGGGGSGDASDGSGGSGGNGGGQSRAGAEAAAEAARAQQVAVVKLAEALGQCHTVVPAVGSGDDPVSGSAAAVPAASTRGSGGGTVAVNTAGGSAAVAPTAPALGGGSGDLPVGGTAADALALDRCAALSGIPSYGEGLRYERHMMWVELRLLQHLDTTLTGEMVILRAASSAAFEAAKRLPCHSPGDWWCCSCGTRSLQTHSTGCVVIWRCIRLGGHSRIDFFVVFTSKIS
jgi:hypothetical protein